jgi:peptidyl-prolyl cis-trans isomerase C
MMRARTEGPPVSLHTGTNQMRLDKSATLIVGAALLLTLGACNPAKPTAPTAKEPAAATVNGTPISQKMVDLIAKRGVAAGRPDTPEARATIVDQLTLQVVLADEAIKKGLDKSPEVAEQFEAIKQSVLANAYVEDFLKTNPVSDEEIQAAYDRIKATITGSEYKASHILVDKESDAKDIIAKLKKDPSSFAKLAAERSKDEGSKDKGGDLGWFDLSRMVPEFGAAASKLEKGQFTQEPVKTQFGYHVILLEDSKPIEAPPIEDVKVQLTQQIQQQNVKKQMEALKAAAKIEVASATASTAPATEAAPDAAN